MNQVVISEARDKIVTTIKEQCEQLDSYEKLEVYREVSLKLTEMEWAAEEAANDLEANGEEIEEEE